MVAHVTGEVFRRGGTIEDASMTRLGGEFAMMLVIGMPGSKAQAFLKALPGLQKKLALNLNAKAISPALARARKQSQATHLISIYGIDRPGIVYKATDLLARQRINITDLNTRVLQRSGKALYLMLLEVQLADRRKVSALRRALTRLGRSLKLDATLQELESVAL